MILFKRIGKVRILLTIAKHINVFFFFTSQSVIQILRFNPLNIGQTSYSKDYKNVKMTFDKGYYQYSNRNESQINF